MNLPNLSFAPIDPVFFPPDLKELPRTAKRMTQLLSKGLSSSITCAQKKWSLDFLLSPKSFEASSEAPDVLSSILFQKMVLHGPSTYESSTKAIPSTGTTSLDAPLAFRSIGYKSEAIEGMKDLGIDFDIVRGFIPNDSCGRVTSLVAGEAAIPGLYCSGWVKRGPAGVIANTMEDAFSTAEAICSDWVDNQPFMSGGDGWDILRKEADQRGLRPVSWEDWHKIDAAEKARGKLKGKEREKFSSTQEMLEVLS